VLKCFTRNEAMVDGRVVKGRKARQRKVRKREQMGVQGDHGAGQVNGHSGTDSEDVEMIADGVVDVPNGQKEDQAEEDLPNGHTNGDSRHPQTPGPRRKRKHRATMSDGHHEAVQNGGGDLNGDEQSPDDDEGEADDASSSAEVQSLDASGAWISCMAASHDGQWLALCATSGRTSVFNLDTLQVGRSSLFVLDIQLMLAQLHASLPTFPTPPAALLFAPSHPSLLGILLPTNNLIFYAIEDRRLLPPSQQIHTLNQALRPQYSPPQSASFEPSRSNPRSAKLIIWSHDWLCTARLDLDLIARTPGRKGSLMSPGSPSDVSRSLRRKRAREAREQLELVSASMSMSPSVQSSDRTGTGAGTSLRGQSSANDPESIRISNDGFRGVAGVEWLGEGELAVVERPYEDYVGELPAAFWSGGFGKR